MKPSIGATSGDATRTRSSATLDNLLMRQRRRSPATGERSDPLASPPVSSCLAGDDDGRAPSDLVLIVRPRLIHTVSGFKPR
jgi:hypothetical protein